MTEEQKRFKIMKKTSYEEIVSKAGETANSSAFSLGVYAAATICALFVVAKPDVSTITKLVFAGLGMTESTFSALSLKSLIQAISKKTMYESKNGRS